MDPISAGVQQFRLSELGSLFAWLINHGVTSDRIARLLGTTPGNVRVVASRWRQRLSPPGKSVPPLGDAPDTPEKNSLGIRSHHDEVVTNGARETSLDEIGSRLDRITTMSRSQHRYREGIKELRSLLPLIGYAADSRRIALRAAIHEQLAWFNCHLGRSTSAVEETRKSMALWRAAFHESNVRDYAAGYARSAMAGSNASLLAQMPETSWGFLNDAESAAASINEPLGSDHLRQRGVACFQFRNDDLAKSYFAQALHATHDIRDSWTPATPLLASDRHIGLIGTPNWDRVLEVRSVVGSCFGDDSLQFSMATTWAAACGLSSDSPTLWQSAHELLVSNVALAMRFDHQATVTKTLSIAVELGLYPRLQRLFVRRALYENVARRY